MHAIRAGEQHTVADGWGRIDGLGRWERPGDTHCITHWPGADRAARRDQTGWPTGCAHTRARGRVNRREDMATQGQHRPRHTAEVGKGKHGARGHGWGSGGRWHHLAVCCASWPKQVQSALSWSRPPTSTGVATGEGVLVPQGGRRQYNAKPCSTPTGRGWGGGGDF